MSSKCDGWAVLVVIELKSWKSLQNLKWKKLNHPDSSLFKIAICILFYTLLYFFFIRLVPLNIVYLSLCLLSVSSYYINHECRDLILFTVLLYCLEQCLTQNEKLKYLVCKCVKPFLSHFSVSFSGDCPLHFIFSCPLA